MKKSKIQKSKTTVVILAVLFAFWTWLYTYQDDSWKFWLNLILSLTIIWIPVAWIWSIIDVSKKPEEYYLKY
ncbi:hypothetical protein HYV50_01825 [Candidatus Pacearchaeota archaeon]|nr:hypothetical protein [Candidatus Pacearchaeota archaeon]